MKSVADLYAEFEQEGASAPEKQSAAGLYAEFEAEESEKDQRVRSLVGSHMAAPEEGDRDVAAARLSEATGIEPRIVGERFDEIDKKWKESQFNPRALRESNPWIDAVLEARPDLAPLVAKDVQEGNLGGASGSWESVNSGVGEFLLDTQTAFASGVASGTASAAMGFGEFFRGAAQIELEKDARRMGGSAAGLQVPNPLRGAAGELSEISEQIMSRLSPAGQAATEGSAPSGDLFSPSTWSLGDDPSLRGYLLSTTQVFGGMTPIVIASIAAGPAGGAVVGGAQAGGGAVEQARAAVEYMGSTPSSPEDGAPLLIEVESEVYRALRAEGKTHAQAVEATALQAEQAAFLPAALVGGVGGALTGKLLDPATKLLAGRGALTQLAGRTGLSSLEEGTQEALESIATGFGIEAGAGVSLDLTEDTFGDFLLGALGGAPVGAMGAAGAVGQERAARRSEAAKRILEAAKKSHLAKASPTTFSEVVAPEAESLYLDAEPTLRLFQDAGVDPRQFFTEEQLSEAKLTGGKLEVPVSRLPDLVNTGIEARLAEHATTHAEEPTAAQAQALEAEAQALAAEIDAVAPGEAEARLLALLEEDAAAAFKAKDAKPNLALWRAFVRTQAAQMGMPAEAVFAEIEVKLRRQGGEATQAAATAAVETTPAAGASAAEPAAADVNPPRDNFDRILERVNAERSRVDEMVAAGPNPQSFPARDGGMIVVSEDASKPGRWRATKLDASGEPTGHIEAEDFRGALNAARQSGAQILPDTPAATTSPAPRNEVTITPGENGPAITYRPAAPPPLPIVRALAQAEEEIRHEPNEHLRVFDPTTGEEVFRSTSGQVDAVQVSKADRERMMQRGGLVITHNHPIGGAVSYPDIAIAISVDAAEIRAVMPDGRVTRVRRPKGGWKNKLKLNRLTNLTEAESKVLQTWTIATVKPLEAAHRRGMEAAKARMYEVIKAAGGDPRDGDKATGYDRDTWIRIQDEETAREINEHAARTGEGWQIDRLDRGAGGLSDVQSGGGSAAEAGLTLRQDATTPRGYLERRGNEFSITLTPNADRSTFLHETGHAFLEITLDLAERPDATEATKKQAADILNWLGIASRADLTTEHHETWARAFEAYLMEGKAPSPELESAFQKFRNWLTRIYLAIKNLNVELSDDVRGIFDRLLATDEEIRRAAPTIGPKLFNSPEEAGMTLQEYERYLREYGQIFSLAQKRGDLAQVKEHLRTLEKAWKDELAEIRKQAEADYEELPERKAYAALRGRTGLTIRLDYKQVVRILGKERARRFLTAKIGGSNIDEAAQLLGYQSGAEMLRKIDELPTKDEWAKAEADKRIREKHPSMLERRDLLRSEIAKGLHGDHTLEWHLREHRALMRKAGIEGEPPPLAVIRRAAEIVAERRRVKNLSPHVAQRAAATAGNRAYIDASKGDYAKASAQKRVQIVNEALYRHLRDNRDEMNAAEDYLKTQAKKAQRQKVGKAAEGAFLPGYDSLLASVGIGVERGDLTARLDAFDALTRLAEIEGNPLGADVSALRAIIAKPRAWKDLTVQEARAVRDAIRRVRTITRQMLETQLAGEKIAAKELVARIGEEARAKRPDLGPLYAARQQKTIARRGFDMALGLHGAMIDPGHMLETLGPTARQFFGDAFFDAKAKKLELSERYGMAIEKLWRNMPEETKARRFEVLTDFYDVLGFAEGVNLGRPVDRLTLLMIALNMGNPHNAGLVTNTVRGTHGQVLAYLNQHLTEAEWQWVQSVWDALEGMWPEIAAKEQRVNGVPPERVTPMPVETPFGTLRGGYFPAKVDPRIRRTSQGATQEAVAAYHDPGYRSAATPKSHTKSRAPNAAYVVDLDWSMVPSHVAQVVHDIAYDEWVRKSARIAEDPEMRTTLQRVLGENRARELSEWIKFVSNQQAVSAAQVGNAWAKVGMQARGHLAVAALGWSGQVAIQDLTNAPIAIARGSGAGGISRTWGSLAYVAGLPGVSHLGNWRKTAMEKSDYLRGRAMGESEARRREFLIGVGLNRSVIVRGIDAVASTAFYFLEYMDKISSTQIWLGKYWEEKAAGANEAEAVRMADRAVQDNLPTMDKAEQAAIMRQPGYAGAMLTFFGYFSKLYNITAQGLGGSAVQAVTEAARAGTWKASGQASLEIAKLAGRFAAVMVIAGPAAEYLSGRGPDEDEDPEEWAARISVSMPANMTPYVGGILSAGISAAMGDSSRFYVTARAPIQSLAADMIKDIGKMASEGDDESKLWAALEMTLLAAKLPVRQSKRTLEYLSAVYSGEEEPEDIFAFLNGVIYGLNRPSTPLTSASDLLQGR